MLLVTCCIFEASAEEKKEVVQAETYVVGSQVAAFKSKDKNGAAYTFVKGTKFLLISFDMKTGKKANTVLSAKGAAYLPAKKTVYIANIYGMPKIGRMFALPKMKKYTHPIILADAKNLLTPFPKTKGMVTVLKLDSKAKVESISYWDPEATKIEDVIEK